MSDPFGSNNPFATSTAATAEHADPFAGMLGGDAFAPPPPPAASAAQEEGTPVVEEVLFSNDDPFGSVTRAVPSAPTPAPPSNPQSQAVPTLKATAAREDGEAKEQKETSSAPLTLVEWKDEAVELGRRIDRWDDADKRQEALAYATQQRIAVSPDIHRDVPALTQHLRLSPSGLPWHRCSRVEVSGATRHPGKGMELAYWVYTFKIYTLLEPYKGQPHQEGQKETHFGVFHNLTVLTIDRRYKDFEWLRKALVVENPGVVVPPIPDKTWESLREKINKKGEEQYAGKDIEQAGVEQQAEWQDDKAVVVCNSCETKFTFTTRRHHCRHCMKVFCSTCCPKPSGTEKRMCKDCSSMKGLGEMLSKNPDVAFRMKGLALFLSECLTGPLAMSSTLRFFLEAPPNLLYQKRDQMLKALETSHHVWARGASDMVKDKAADFQKWMKGAEKAAASLSPRGKERRAHYQRVQEHMSAFANLRFHLSVQLAEGLRKKKRPIPPLEGSFQNDENLSALFKATEHVEACNAQFLNINKEHMFLIISRANFVIGMLQSMLDHLSGFDRVSRHRRSTSSNPERRAAINDFLDKYENTIETEMRHVIHVVSTSFKAICQALWKLEAHRDPAGYEWDSFGSMVVGIKDPVF